MQEMTLVLTSVLLLTLQLISAMGYAPKMFSVSTGNLDANKTNLKHLTRSLIDSIVHYTNVQIFT